MLLAEQIQYAVQEVEHLHALKEKLDAERVFEKSRFRHFHRLCSSIPPSKQLGQTLIPAP
jgi:ribonuclease D